MTTNASGALRGSGAYVDCLVLTAGFLALNLPSLLTPFGLDQAIVAIIARGISDGYMPYTDLWDHNAPGIFLIYRLAFWLFGESEVGLNVFDLLYREGAMLAIYAVGRLLLPRGAAILSAICYLLAATVHFQVFWFQAQRETFLVLPLVAACLAITVHRRRPHFALPILAGASWAVAVAIKPNAVLIAPFYLVFLGASSPTESSVSARMRAIAVFCLTAMAMALPVVAWLATNNAFAAAWEAIVSFNVFHAAPQNPPTWATRLGLLDILVRQFPAVMTLAAIGCWFLVIEERWSDRQYLILWFVLLLIAVIIQNKLFGYHAILLLPAGALLAGFGLYRLSECLTLSPSPADQ